MSGCLKSICVSNKLVSFAREQCKWSQANSEFLRLRAVVIAETTDGGWALGNNTNSDVKLLKTCT